MHSMKATALITYRKESNANGRSTVLNRDNISDYPGLLLIRELNDGDKR